MIIDEKILLAASELPPDGFNAEDLVVATFKKFPLDFCLMGFPEYPDSNKVLTQITTSGRGLQKRGWLVQIGTKRYQLTGEGFRHLAVLKPEQNNQGFRSDNRDIAELILHWLRSNAYQKFKLDQRERITEQEALAYWRLTAGASAAKTHRYLAVAESAINFLSINTNAQQQAQIHHGRSISPLEASQIIDLHKYLKERHAKELHFLQSQRH